MDDATGQEPLTETQQKAFRAKVTESLWAYEEIDGKLRDRVRDYLVDGEDASCILELAAAYQNKNRKRFFKQQHGTTRVTDRVDRRKLFGLFEVAKAPPGYYRRLGEIAGQVPEVKQPHLESDAHVATWLSDLIVLRWLLSADPYTSYYGASRRDPAFQLRPYLLDLDENSAVASLIALAVASESTDRTHIARYLCTASDWAAILKDYPAELASSLKAANAASREAALEWLVSQEYDFRPILPVITELAVSPSNRVRPLALNVLRPFPEEAGRLLADQLSAGNAAERTTAAEALVAILGRQAESHLQAALKNEKGPRVRQTIESLLSGLRPAEADDAASPASDVALGLPPIDMPSGELPLPDGFADKLWEHLEAAFDKLDQQYQKQVEAYNAPNRPTWMSKPQQPKRMDRPEFDHAMSCLEGKAGKRPSLSPWVRQAMHSLPVWTTWADLTKLHLVHVARFMSCFGYVAAHHQQVLHFTREDWVETHRNAQPKPYGLREVDAAFAVLPNVNRGVIARTYLQWNNSWQTCLDWESEAVWPLFAEHPDIFRDAILGVSAQRNDYFLNERRRTAMRVAAMMPHLPFEIENAMWTVALGEGKTDRPAARRALHAAKNRLARALAAIGDGKQGVRIAGAEMLGELGDAAAIEPLKKALTKEKQEIVKGAMLQALEQLGGDVDEFLGRRKQLLDAKKGLERKRPKGMEWVPLESLPEVRWAEDNKPLATEILQWWVIQSIQFKLPVCGAILRRSVAMCRHDDAAKLARHLLAAWIAYDTKRPSQEEVLAEATKQAAQQWNNKAATWLRDHYKTEENYRDQLASQMQNTFLQSAIGEKGLLAIVSAAGDAQCVKLMERYIRTYHGQRLAQSKALLETLGWIEDATAVQLLLSLANRFRTKGIRSRAAEMVQELADRQGWTMDQLADRTIPDAGFERPTDAEGHPIGERAELVLDYGSRKFAVILGDDLQPVITRDDGKLVQALPAAAKDDDPELVKDAKNAFSAARKTVKEVVKSQAERLYEAACVQRAWPADEWRRYLAQHPIAGALCRRVVWAARSPDESQPVRLFRPLEDGTLTDVHDDEFTLPDTDRVLVAHSSLLDEATEQAWKQHLQDYEVPQLFKQFGRPTYRLPDEKKNEAELFDFRGHMLTTFRLRSRATKLGWVRGEAQDGGSFATYHKPFRSERVEAVVEFTGSYLPEPDIPAAIRELYFVPLKPNDESASAWNPNKLKLGKVPPVLLSECYNDVRDMAAEGTGFDPDWEKKGLW